MKKLLFISLIFLTLFSSTTLLSQDTKVRVYVYLGPVGNGIGITGASVSVKNSQLGAVTNQNGWAELTCAGNATLVVSATGTNPVEEPRNFRSEIKVSLFEIDACLMNYPGASPEVSLRKITTI
jgi:hypothetical protein